MYLNFKVARKSEEFVFFICIRSHSIIIKLFKNNLLILSEHTSPPILQKDKLLLTFHVEQHEMFEKYP
jgi:hypothetical protein